jgi:hypothetical protein
MTSISFDRDAGLGARWMESRFERAGRPVLTLAQAVEAAVRKLDGRSLVTVAGLQATALLAVLTFFYARQNYSSKEIAAHLQNDFNSVRILNDGFPDALLLKRFREANRGALAFCLESALTFLAREKIQQGSITHVKETNIAQEARRRITMAMFVDSLEIESEGASSEEFGARFPAGYGQSVAGEMRARAA